MMSLVAFSLMLMSCGGQSANKSGRTGADDDAAAEETADAKKAVVEENADEGAPEGRTGDSEILNIRRVWGNQPIAVASDGKTVNIEVLASAFCKQYAKYKPNEVLRENLVGKPSYGEDDLGSLFNFENKSANGYLSCMAMIQYDWLTTCCYWKRSNGHKLVAFWLLETYEGDKKPACLLAFYDYDPATDTMTPETGLTKKVEEKMSSFDAYTVHLPDEGKDINITGHQIDYEEDCAYNTDFLLRWNGNDFAIEQVPGE